MTSLVIIGLSEFNRFTKKQFPTYCYQNCEISPVGPGRVHARRPTSAQPGCSRAPVAALINVVAVAVVADLEPFVAVAAERPLVVCAGPVLEAAVGALIDVDARAAAAAVATVVVAVVTLALVAPGTVQALSVHADAVLSKTYGVSLTHRNTT